MSTKSEEKTTTAKNSKLVKETTNENAIETTKNSQVVYIGPTLKGIVTKNTIFASGIPSEVKEQLNKYPILNKLVIPIKNLPKVNMEMQTGGAHSVLYARAVEQITKGGR